MCLKGIAIAVIVSSAFCFAQQTVDTVDFSSSAPETAPVASLPGEQAALVQEFTDAGFNTNDFSKAQKLNLDLQNFIQYKHRNKALMQGRILTGVGGGVTGLGAVLAGLGGIVYALRDAPTLLDNVNYEAMGIVYMVAGGVVAVGGLTTLISGSLKKGSAHRIPVKTMDGNDLGVSLDVETGAVGLVYLMRF